MLYVTCMYVCMYVCIYIYIYIYTCIYIYIYMSLSLSLSIYIYIYIGPAGPQRIGHAHRERTEAWPMQWEPPTPKPEKFCRADWFL